MSKDFRDILKTLVDNIYSSDLETQKYYLPTLHKDVRGSDSYEILFKAKAFFVPNEEYVSVFGGPNAKKVGNGFYNSEGNSIWIHKIILPVIGVDSEIKGMIAYSPFVKAAKESKDLESELISRSTYTFPSAEYFEKSKYVYFIEDNFNRAVSEGYVVLTDGSFDMLSFAANGIISWSLMGSSISPIVAFCLRLVKNVFLAHDNDTAGLKLLRELQKIHPRVFSISQDAVKDADKIISDRTSTENREMSEMYLEAVRLAITEKRSVSVRYKTSKRGVKIL